jgi:hypothetical protein
MRHHPPADAAPTSTWSRRLRRVLLGSAFLCAGFAGAGCATASSADGTDMRTLTESEIRNVQASNALEVVRLLRPRWLQSRGDRSFGAIGQSILVYENGARLGTVEEVLHLVPAGNIIRMEWVDGSSAGLLPGAGSGHVEAAILISTTRRPS